jgi:hypothetical protein
MLSREHRFAKDASLPVRIDLGLKSCGIALNRLVALAEHAAFPVNVPREAK